MLSFKPLYFFLILSFTFSFGFGQNIIGKWKVERILSNDKTSDALLMLHHSISEKIYHFTDEQLYYITINKGEVSDSGRIDMSMDSLKFYNMKGDRFFYSLDFLEDEKMTLVSPDSVIVVFSKLKE